MTILLLGTGPGRAGAGGSAALGGFTGFLPDATSSGNAGANSMFMSTVTAQQSGIAKAVLIGVPGTTSGINFKALVYDSAHNALLATGSTVTSVTAGYNRLPLTTNLNLTAGTNYFAGYVCDASCPVIVGTLTGGVSWFVSGGQSVASPANPLVGGSSSGVSLMIALEHDQTGASSGSGYSVDQSSSVILSSLNTVATFSGAAQQGARSLVTRAPGGGGNWYAEIAVSGSSFDASGGIGIGAVAWNPHQATPVSSLLWALKPGGSTLAGVGLGVTWGAGDVIGIAYNSTSNFLWWNKNNGSWFGASSTAGNPVTGTGPLILSSNWPLAILVLSAATGTTGAFTLRDKASSLQYTPPSGYSAWSPA